MVANFNKFLISPGFMLNFRKVTKFQRVISKALRVMAKKLRGFPKDPPLDRIGLMVETCHVQLAATCEPWHISSIFMHNSIPQICKPSNKIYNIPRACLLNRPPVPAMDLKAIDQACDVTC